jgi:hypothetical protein
VLLRVLRCFDGICYSLLALVVLICPQMAPLWAQRYVHPIGVNILGQIDVLSVTPMLAIAWFCHRLPLAVDGVLDWHRPVIRVRLYSLACAGLFPLAVLWTTLPQNTYLGINTMLAGAAAIGLLCNLNRLVHGLAVRCKNDIMTAECVLTAHLLIYGLVVPYAALLFLLQLLRFFYQQPVHMLLLSLPNWILMILLVLVLAMVTPMAFTVTLLMRMRPILAQELLHALQPADEAAAPEPTPAANEPLPAVPPAVSD